MERRLLRGPCPRPGPTYRPGGVGALGPGGRATAALRDRVGQARRKADRPGGRPQRVEDRRRASGSAGPADGDRRGFASPRYLDDHANALENLGCDRVFSVNDRFLSLFFEEAHELLQALEAGLMDLEAPGGPANTWTAPSAPPTRSREPPEWLACGRSPISRTRSRPSWTTSAPDAWPSRAAITILLRAKDYLGTALNEAAHGRMTRSPAGALWTRHS